MMVNMELEDNILFYSSDLFGINAIVLLFEARKPKILVQIKDA